MKKSILKNNRNLTIWYLHRIEKGTGARLVMKSTFAKQWKKGILQAKNMIN